MEHPLYKRILPKDYKNCFIFKGKKKVNGVTALVGYLHEIVKVRTKTTLMYGVPYTSNNPENAEFMKNVKDTWEKHFIMSGEELHRYLTNAEIRKYKIIMYSGTKYIVNNDKFKKIVTFSGFTGYLEPVVTFKTFTSSDTTDTFGDLMDEL